MPFFRIFKEIFKNIEACDSMPLHFEMTRPILLHGIKIPSGKYNYVSHDSLEHTFLYQTKNHKTISLSLSDYQFLIKSKAAHTVKN